MLHHLIGKRFRKKATALPAQPSSLSSPWESQYLNPVQAAQRGLLLASLHSGKPSECHSHTLTEQTCSSAVITAIFTNGATIVEKKWNKPQLSNPWAQKISLLADDPSTTSWRTSQEDLPPLCLHNRGHKGENTASYITSSQIPFLIIFTPYLITADSCLV